MHADNKLLKSADADADADFFKISIYFIMLQLNDEFSRNDCHSLRYQSAGRGPNLFGHPTNHFPQLPPIRFVQYIFT